MVYIASLDVGTTNVRCLIVNECFESVGLAVESVELLSPQPGYFEIEPEALWSKIVRVIHTAIENANLRPSQIACLALCCQRCTFVTWNHRTREYYHNFITWKDVRASDLVHRWNSGFWLRQLNTVAYILYMITRSKRFLAASMIRMMNGQVTMRLLHEMRKNPKLQRALGDRKARIEFLDSWILYQLRSGNGLDPSVEHISDVTSCTATGLFDPFTLTWSPIMTLIIGIDPSLLPQAVHNGCGELGTINPAAMGSHHAKWRDDVRIPIAASASDQTAAMWGSGCLNKGDLKITMGTGAFVNLVTGSDCLVIPSLSVYPLVGWQLPNADTGHISTTYCVEGALYDAGTVISWACNCGLIRSASESADIALSVHAPDGVYFVPPFVDSSLDAHDCRTTAGFIGIKASTRRAHLVRALLESIVFRLLQVCHLLQQETHGQVVKVIKVGGGVSCNDFICQFLADAASIPVERGKNNEVSAMGISYMAGINLGLRSDMKSLRPLHVVDRRFEPNNTNNVEIHERFKIWSQALQRFGNWFN